MLGTIFLNSSCFIPHLVQESAGISPGLNLACWHVFFFVKEILLEHRYSVDVGYCLCLLSQPKQQSWVIMTEIIWLAKPNFFLSGPLRKPVPSPDLRWSQSVNSVFLIFSWAHTLLSILIMAITTLIWTTETASWVISVCLVLQLYNPFSIWQPSNRAKRKMLKIYLLPHLASSNGTTANLGVFLYNPSLSAETQIQMSPSWLKSFRVLDCPESRIAGARAISWLKPQPSFQRASLAAQR